MALRQQAANQNWTWNLVLSSIFALLASFQLGFNMISFSMLKNLIRRFAKNEACLSYIQSSRHFRTIRLLDDFRITADTVELYEKRMNLSMICTLKNNPAIRTMLDSYMMDFLDFMCKVHYDTEKMIKIGDIMFVIGALIGSGSSKYVIETFGRKNSILVHYLLTFVGSMLVIISVLKESVVILAVSQFFFGMQAGQAAALVPIYLNEIAPSSKRIQISSLHSLVLVAGFVTAQATLGPHIIDIDADFSYTYIILLGFPFIPAMISSIGLFYFCPDSPRALLLLHQDEHSAIISLKILRKSQFVRYEIEEIIKSANLFVKTKFRWVKLVFIELCFVFTIIAIEILFFNFSSFKKLVYFKDGIFISLFALICSVFSTAILSRFSITSLVKISLAGLGTVIMVLIVEAYFLFVKFSEDLFDYMFTDFFLVTICLIVLLVLFFSIGLLPIALLYPVDLFMEDKKSNSQAICISFICAVYLCFQLCYSLLTSSPIAFLIFFTFYIILIILTAFILVLKPSETLIAEF